MTLGKKKGTKNNEEDKDIDDKMAWKFFFINFFLSL